MTKLIRSVFNATLTATCLLAASQGVQAATTNWSANFGGCTNGSTVAAAGAWSASVSTNCPSETGGVDVQVGGLSWTYAGNNSYTPGNATVVSYGTSGLGVVSQGESASATGPHAIDNVDRYDSVVAKFSTAVSLSGLSIGWNGTDNPTNTTVNGTTVSYNDSDVAVYAWTGTTPAPGTGPTALSPLGGWTLVSLLNNVGAMANNTASFSTTVTSSYWMIAAYGNQDCNYDAFKLLTLAGTVTTTPPTNQVAEPGAMALAGLSILGVAVARRRKAVR